MLWYLDTLMTRGGRQAIVKTKADAAAPKKMLWYFDTLISWCLDTLISWCLDTFISTHQSMHTWLPWCLDIFYLMPLCHVPLITVTASSCTTTANMEEDFINKPSHNGAGRVENRSDMRLFVFCLNDSFHYVVQKFWLLLVLKKIVVIRWAIGVYDMEIYAYT
jgi:hypothetical protein